MKTQFRRSIFAVCLIMCSVPLQARELTAGDGFIPFDPDKLKAALEEGAMSDVRKVYSYLEGGIIFSIEHEKDVFWEKRLTQVVDHLNTSGVNVDWFELACRYESMALLRHLVQQKYPLSKTTMSHAVLSGNPELIDVLVEAMCPPLNEGAIQIYAMKGAIQRADLTAIKALLKAGHPSHAYLLKSVIDVLEYHDNKTPLTVRQPRKTAFSTAVLVMLLESGADPNEEVVLRRNEQIKGAKQTVLTALIESASGIESLIDDKEKNREDLIPGQLKILEVTKEHHRIQCLQIDLLIAYGAEVEQAHVDYAEKSAPKLAFKLLKVIKK